MINNTRVIYIAKLWQTIYKKKTQGIVSIIYKAKTKIHNYQSIYRYKHDNECMRGENFKILGSGILNSCAIGAIPRV